jgi:hypothetical protein
VIQRYVPPSQARRALVEVLVPADPELWARRAIVDEDLLTWWAVMVHLQEALRGRHAMTSAGIAVGCFKHLGQVLRQAGATSGAELVDGGGAIVAPRVRHGAFRYER